MREALQLFSKRANGDDSGHEEVRGKVAKPLLALPCFAADVRVYCQDILWDKLELKWWDFTSEKAESIQEEEVFSIQEKEEQEVTDIQVEV